MLNDVGFVARKIDIGKTRSVDMRQCLLSHDSVSLHEVVVSVKIHDVKTVLNIHKYCVDLCTKLKRILIHLKE